MTRIDVLNAVVLAVALLVSVAGAGLSDAGRNRSVAAAHSHTTAIRDAGGEMIRVAEYRRIVSASPVADVLLLDLCERSRIAAVTLYGATRGRVAHRMTGLPTLARMDDLEAVISLRPDLLLVHRVGAEGPTARLREVGVVVVDLGTMTGLESLLEDIEQVAVLCGREETGRLYAETLARRMASVAPSDAIRPSAIYLSTYGGRLYGGTRGSSYHDILRFAGLEDAASNAFEGWPQYRVQDVLRMNPQFIVTAEGMSGTICRHPGLEVLQACRNERMLALRPELLDDAGPGMLEATESLRDLILVREDAN